MIPLRDALDDNPSVFRFGEAAWSLGISEDMPSERKAKFQEVWKEIIEAEPILVVRLGKLFSRLSEGMDDNQQQEITSIFYYRATSKDLYLPDGSKSPCWNEIREEEREAWRETYGKAQSYLAWFTLIEKYAPGSKASPQERLGWLQRRAWYINE